MDSTRMRVVLLPLFSLLLAVLACNLPVQNQQYNSAAATMQVLDTRVAGTEKALSAMTQSDSGTSPTPGTGLKSEEEESVKPTSTPVPSETPTSSPTPCVPKVSVSKNTNCRKGPGTVYDLAYIFMVGDEAEIVSRSSVPNYWVIDSPNNPGQHCWLWGQYAQVSCDTSDLPIMTPPPTPTPTPIPYPDWSGTWMTWSSMMSPNPFSLTINQSGEHLTGHYTVNGDTYTFSADLFDDGMRASGDTYNPDSTHYGWLFWNLLENRNQFRGSFGGNWGAWCGALNGEPMPSPCANY